MLIEIKKNKLIELNTENVDYDDCDNEEAISKEIRFVPDDSSHLEAIYRSMCECQLMHPDQEDQDSDEDNDYMDEFDEGGDQDDDKHNGDEQMEEGQFDDAA
ncbi:Methylosome subunit pICln-like protein 1 [Sarcoptes scabiei]|uniref:Methylosome subunit pICln-like protein 1 n=1 Tax=Sarcoptes scabiei TaxID=52283 RepID=A0A132ABY5_SARSC|nr:Methylosome subunit pICln-like protein 1 [Sarcoptes scabiei]